MKSLADGLLPDIARQVHPDWRKNEAAYWAVRDQLLSQYQNQWIGFADGKVVAFGGRPVEVSHAARRAADHPFVVCVGREGEPVRIRRARFSYDTGYHAEPLPVIAAEFRLQRNVPGLVFDRVILDTGADTSVLPWADCQQLQFDPAIAAPAHMTGIGGGSATTLSFSIWVLLNANEYECQVYVDFVGVERILGRDVLNSLDVLFRGPGREVIINP